MKKTFFLTLLISTTLYSCFDSSERIVNRKEDLGEEPGAEIPTLVLRSTNNTIVDVSSDEFVGVSQIEDFKAYAKEFSLNLEEMTLIRFDEEKRNSTRAIVIPIKQSSLNRNLSKNLVVYYKNNYTKYRFQIVEREGTIEDGYFSGTSRLKTMDQQTLLEESITKNKYTKLVLYRVKEKSTYTAKQAECSYEEFNFYYQKLKSNCSADAACDIACTLSGPVCVAGISLQAFEYCWTFDYNPGT